MAICGCGLFHGREHLKSDHALPPSPSLPERAERRVLARADRDEVVGRMRAAVRIGGLPPMAARVVMDAVEDTLDALERVWRGESDGDVAGKFDAWRREIVEAIPPPEGEKEESCG
jgi:hypothetical protein